MVKLTFINDLCLFINDNTKAFKKNQHIRKHSINDLVTALFDILKSGIAYNEQKGLISQRRILWISYGSIYHTLKVLKRYNIMEKYYKFLLGRYFENGLGDKLKYTLVDTTFIVNQYSDENIGRSKEYKWKNGKKVSLITDKYGIPISVSLGPGNESDNNLLIKNLNKLFIDTKSYLYKNNNRYKQYIFIKRYKK